MRKSIDFKTPLAECLYGNFTGREMSVSNGRTEALATTRSRFAFFPPIRPGKIIGIERKAQAPRSKSYTTVPRGFWIRSFVSPPRTMQELGPVPDPDPISRQSQVAK